MQGVLFSCFLILIAINGIYAMTYSQSIVGLGPAKGKACPFIQIQGGVQWKPQPIQDACVGKKVNSLFVVEPGTLALCDGTKRGANGLDPLLLGLGALQRPSYLVTSTVTYTAPNCPWAAGIPQSVSRADFKSYLLQLDNRWATYDQICQSEFGSEYVAASPHDAIFAVDGRSPVLNWDLNLAGQDPSVAFNLRGGYGFWLDSSSAAGSYPHSYPWQLGFIWSDCYGGQGSPTYTPRANVQSCSPNNIWSDGALYDSGPSIPQGYAPVLCKKTNLLQYSTFITSTNDTCTSGFGIAYDRISANGLHQGVRTPVVQPNCGAGYCFNKAENNIVDIDGDSVFPTIDTSTGRPIFQLNTGSGPSCLNTKQGYNEQTCEQTFPF